MERIELTGEIIDVMFDNGCEEPWCMALVDGFVDIIPDESYDIHISCGKTINGEFVSFDLGLLHNIFEVNGSRMVYWVMSNMGDGAKRVLELDLDVILKKGEFQKEVNRLVRYLDVQLRVGHVGDMGEDEFYKLFVDLL